MEGEQSAEVLEEAEDLKQRLFKAEERAIGAEQEAVGSGRPTPRDGGDGETGRRKSHKGTHRTVGAQKYSGGAANLSG